MINSDSSKKIKLIITGTLVIASLSSIVYFHFFLKISIVFTQFFYIPIILGSLWWQKKGIIVSLILAFSLILSRHLISSGLSGIDDYFRAFFFVVVSAVVALLSEKDLRLQEKINENLKELHEKKSRLENEIEERVQAEQISNALLNVTTESIFMLDRDGTILEVNEIAAKRLGKTRSTLIGKCFYDHLPPNVARLRKEKIDEICRTKKTIRIQAERDNIIFDINMCPVIDADAGVSRIALFARDITPLLKLQKEIIEISENERQLLGQDLHDDLGQYLTGIKYMTTSLGKKITANEHFEAEEFFEISSHIGKAIDRIRRLARSLYPVALESSGLRAALDEMCFEVENIFNVSCKITADSNIGEIGKTVSAHLYYIAQESINNALKHANAKNISLSLSKRKNLLKMNIENDFGFMGNADKKGKGIGIDIMKYRANLIHANLEFKNTPDKYVVSLRITI